jgi:two-component system chemotaxis response regulator CheY
MNANGRSVLVVDDIGMMRELLGRMLRSLGFADVVGAGSAKDALKAIEARSFDLVLVDWNLGDDNGGELVTRLRAGAGAKLPILMVSGQSERETVLAAQRAGIDGYLLKPVSKADLEARVRFVLSKRGGAAAA